MNNYIDENISKTQINQCLHCSKKAFCEVIKYLLCYDSMYYREIEVLSYGKVKSSYVIC